ncbi:hypothetical protein CLV62_101334 [Dysgonomonas alginatilytica]|uniref:Uncharacterized protein n=1 Tax=Dysgonomonas alginatilytica TaxID=1605892 RepID=A0A2V3Q157_9BACT|nr:hypothetical protein [Dysgonomonas alginatilytica]PXV69065.1 hypothetical protein CLV62_101334 [Dysgonomonas alginatilytica]
MKKLLFLLIIAISSSYALSAQSESKFIGVYGQKGGDGAGGARLYIFPDGLYSMAYYGGTQHGRWEKYEKYIIMKPDTNSIEKFYMFARYDESIKDISVQFDGFSSSKTVYSFNNGEKDVTMHPVYNPSPNCFTYPQITRFAKGEYTQIQVALIPEYFSANPSETQYNVYTFPVDPKYNDIKILMHKKSEPSDIPFILALENKKLYMPYFEFDYLGSLDEETEENLSFAREIASTAGQPYQSNIFGKEDEYGNWIKIEYPRLRHLKKEFTNIAYDDKNLFTATCDDTTESETVIDERAVSPDGGE